jgi:MFS transporter, Spinster family, sphingosine-1-phosphate transporter
MLFMTFAIGGISFFMPRYMMEAGAGGAGRVGLIFGGITAGSGLLATLAGGWLGDRLRTRWPGSYFIVSAMGLGVGFPLFLGVLYVSSIEGKWVLLVLAVFALFFNTGPSNTILANVTPGRLRPTAFAVNIFVIHALGDAVSPVVIGFVADKSSLRMGFVVVSVTFLLGAVFWLMGAPYLKGDTERVESLEG